MDNPAAYRLRGRRLAEFVGDSFGNEHLTVKRRQGSRLADQDQVAQRGSIGNDDARHGSEAQPAVGLTVLFEIPPRVVQPDLVLLQEAVEFVA